MAKQYKSEALAAAHETAQGLADAGVMAKRTMKAFDEMYLTPVEEMTPEKIQALRLRENASQAVSGEHQLCKINIFVKTKFLQQMSTRSGSQTLLFV